MKIDLFCSIAHTPVDGVLPSEGTMLANFLAQCSAADELGYGTVWVAESHYSTELQKRHAEPVVPHWQGEIGLNNDICQLAAQVFARTRRLDVGSAIMNVICNGGPLPAAERVATALGWHGLDPGERRRLRIGFAAGRFDYINRLTGVGPRTEWERAAWPQVRNAAAYDVRIPQRTAGPERRAPAEHALAAYWSAMDGTIDPAKVASAAGNALIGNADDVAAQLAERFHPEDRVMLWFDFFNHDNDRVVENMTGLANEVLPRLDKLAHG